jgi:hypothetical protein
MVNLSVNMDLILGTLMAHLGPFSLSNFQPMTLILSTLIVLAYVLEY